MEKLASRNIRNNFLKNGDIMELNKYFQKMEKMAIQKGGKYSDMYNEDLDFYISLTDEKQSKQFLNQLGGFLTNKKKSRPAEVVHELSQSLEKETYCGTITNIETCPNRYEKSVVNVYNILDSCNPVAEKNNNETTYDAAIKEFIEFLICCDGFWSKESFSRERDAVIMKTVDKIVKNELFIKEAIKIIRMISHNQTNKIIQEYINLLEKKSKIEFAIPIFPSAFSKSIGLILCGIAEDPTSSLLIFCLK